MVYPRDRYGGYVVKCVQREGRDLPIFFFFARKDVNLLTMSSFNVAYGYELWGKLETGGILTYSYVGSGYNNHTITFMPKAKINWINESNFRFYSLLAIGTVFLFNSEEFKANTLWHLSLAGFEFGKDTSFFWQFGIGQAGFMAWGVKFKL